MSDDVAEQRPAEPSTGGLGRARRRTRAGLLLAALAVTGAVAIAAPVNPLVPAKLSAATLPDRPQRVTLAAVRAYWTPARMAAATPREHVTLADGIRLGRNTTLDRYLNRLAAARSAPEPAQSGANWVTPGKVVRTTGKIFFSMGADDFVCSGSAVDSPDRSTVLTAGHCVYDPETTTLAANWAFVPGYSRGRAPYGIFPSTHLVTTEGWRTSEDFDLDVAFANVAANATGKLLVDAVGGQRIAFNTARGATAFAFGYPAEAPWTGEKLVYCAGRLGPDTSPGPSTDQGMTCTMTPGSSGGPWFANFSRRTGVGTLVSVTSFSYSDQPTVLWGPYLGPVAQTLYAAVAGTTTA